MVAMAATLQQLTDQVVQLGAEVTRLTGEVQRLTAQVCFSWALPHGVCLDMVSLTPCLAGHWCIAATFCTAEADRDRWLAHAAQGEQRDYTALL